MVTQWTKKKRPLGALSQGGGCLAACGGRRILIQVIETL